ncbi:hypothetical protein ACWDBF_21325 [Streptomyces angustmyceticus]
MSTAPASFPGDSDPSLGEAHRRATQSPVSADLSEQRASDRVATILDLQARGADPVYIRKLQQLARDLFAEAAANTAQPDASTWRCRRCDTYNGDGDRFCIVCDSERPGS